LETIREYWGSKKSQKEIELVFDAIRPKNQENQQDEITIDDIRAVAKRLGESLTETDLREMFDFADPQKTGTVTFKEFQTIMKKTAIW
jgi:Ca2+-binding EF-hand superfamily protein